MAQIQCTDVKPKIVTLPNCKDSIDIQQLEHGTIFVKPGDLKLEGNWKIHSGPFDKSVISFIELLESCTFKASGERELPIGGGLYAGHFVVGLSKHNNMGKVRTEKCPPQEEREEDLSNYAPGKMFLIEMGVCGGPHVKFSLANAGIPAPQKGQSTITMSEYSYAPRHRTREPEYVTETTYIERGGRGGGARDLVYRPAAREDSIEEIPRDFPPGAEYRQTKYREEYAPPRRTRSVNRGYDDDYYDRPRRRDRDYDDRSEYSERPNMQRRKSIVDKVKDFGESAGLGGIIGAVTGGGRDRSRSRPRRDDRGYDSDRYGYYDDRDRRSSRYGSRSRSRSRGGRKSEKWEQAAKAAIVAGAVEAFRSRKEAGPWTGAKGQRVATAALGAAGIDGLIDRDPGKHEKRHVAESALGGLVASRLANGSRSRSRAPRGRDDSRSRSRSRARSRSRSIFGRSRSRGRSRSHSSEGGNNGLAKVAGTGAVLAAGKALYDRVRSKSRSRKERSRSSSADSYVPSRRGNRRSYSRGRGMDDQYSEAPSRTNPDRRLAAAGGAGAGALTAQGGGADRGRWDASSDSESSTDMEEKRKKLRAANQPYPTSYADANPYGSSVPPPPMGARY